MSVIDLSPLAVPVSMQLLSPLLPSPPASVLEVGCGRGALAAELQRRGYSVTGVDPAANILAAAHERGVHVVPSRLEDLPEGQYDVVLFTRSLHHVEDLDVTLDVACRQVSAGGQIVLEEFASDGITAAAAAFLYDTIEVLVAAGVADAHERDKPDPLEQWNADRHHLHSRGAMLAALAHRTELGPITETETLWRLVASRLTGPDLSAATAIARTLAGIEKRRIADGDFPPLGFVVAGQVS